MNDDKPNKFFVKAVDSNKPPSTCHVPIPEVTVTSGSTENIHLDGVANANSKRKAVRYGVEITREASPLGDSDIEIEDGKDDTGNMDLYEEEYHTMPPMSRFFAKLANYTGGIEPTANETRILKEKQGKQKQESKLGTLLGVYFPCIQNVFGVLLFIRLVWIVGVAGALQSFIIVLVCCCTTTLTAISMSAIATNGKVPAGGSYFMISRSLGPEFGGAVGLLFYLGTTVAAAMYIIGAVEIFLTYMAPGASIFGDISKQSVLFNNTRVYGTILLFLMMCCVFIGIKFVSKFATLSLACVLFSIVSIYLGIFTSNPSRSPIVCTLGPTLLSRKFITTSRGLECHDNVTGPIYKMYCSDETSESCAFFNANNVSEVPAIPGLASGIFMENFFKSRFSDKNEIYGIPGRIGNKTLGEGPMIADVASNFAILLAIFFPSVTGIMAGSNRSGDLANPQTSIPMGTLLAIGSTSVVYLSSVIFFASTIDGRVMRDKFGYSIGDGLIVAHLAWPHSWVILIGSFLSTVGAGLQSLTGAPRLLQAIAQDNVIPFLDLFKVTTKRGEPLRAQLLTLGIAQAGVLIASIDSITPLITMFFLMCYGFVNLATALNGFLREPSWRPRFKHYHWILSLIGLGLCVALMFVSSWYYALVAIALAGGIYKYIEYRGASKEWGDATQGFQLSAAKKAILKLSDKPMHTKNWRPQMLVFVKLDNEITAIKRERLLTFCYQLRAGRGLAIVATVLEGDLWDRREDASMAKAVLSKAIKEHKLKALPEVLVARDEVEGIKHLTQCAGLGGLRHNSLVLCYPDRWQEDENDPVRWKRFMALVRSAQACECALVVPKNIEGFPIAKQNKPETGTIDMWCIVHDGGLLLLLAHLLMRTRIWSKCSLRVFVVANEKDNNVDLKREVTKFVYDLRIIACIEIVELASADISAYAIQRTLDLQKRKELFREANLRTVDTKLEFQALLDYHHQLDMSPEETSPEVLMSTESPHASVNPIMDTMIEEDTTWSASQTRPAPEGDDMASRNGGTSPKPRPLETVPAAKVANRVTSPTLSPTSLTADDYKKANEFTFSGPHPLKVAHKTVRRMHNAVHLNEMIRGKSESASLVLINLPGPSRSTVSDLNYMEYVETLTEGLPRVLLVRGSGREVVTVFAE